MAQTDKIGEYMRAGCGGCLLATHETTRALLHIERLARGMTPKPWTVKYWTLDSGWMEFAPTRRDEQPDKKTTDPIAALQAICPTDSALQEKSQRTVYVLCDYHKLWEALEAVAITKSLFSKVRREDKFIVFLSSCQDIPPELEKMIPLVRLPLPDREELRDCLLGICRDAGKAPKQMLTEYKALVKQLCNEGRSKAEAAGEAIEILVNRFVSAAQGMTAIEAENAFATMIVRYRGQLGVEAIEAIGEEKAQAVRKSGLLEVVSHEGYNLDLVGGLDLLKAWLRERKRAFVDIQAADDFGLPAPRGVLLVGVPGAGKSLAAKSVSAEWGIPLLRFDPGRVFASLVGQSEQRIRQVCELAEAMAPTVLWIDEIEKGLAGLQSSGVTDSGVTARVFGTLLTWMQERDDDHPVFVVATANDIGNLPAALIRRFDEVFRVDVPTKPERREIWSIHLQKPRRNHPGRKIEDFDMRVLVDCSVGLTGAEIEKAYHAALNAAFIEQREVTDDDLKLACLAITPVTKTMETQIAALREWAESHARPSSSPPDEKETTEDEGVVGFAPGGGKERGRNIHTEESPTEKGD